MQAVSRQIDSLVAEGVMMRRRESQGYPVENESKHMIFAGPPGTGKTEVAREIAPLYKALGLTPTDKFVAPKKSELIGSALGETQLFVQKQFDKARGGVLFIDEAYALVEGKDDMYGKQAVSTLMELMENHRDDTVVILAGYPKEMSDFVDTNPGMESRIATTINFPAYSDKDLYRIAGVFFHKGKYRLEKGAALALRKAIAEYGDGNARKARNIASKIKSAQAQRIAFNEDADLSRITTADAIQGVAAYRESLLRHKEPAS